MQEDKASQFEILAHSLSPDERQKLLSKLVTEKKVYSEKTKKMDGDQGENKESYINKIYEQKGILEKFIIFLKSFFFGKKRNEIIVNEILHDLMMTIEENTPEIMDPSLKQFTHKFANELMIFSIICKDIEQKIALFFEPSYYFGFLCYLYESKFPESLKEQLVQMDPATVDFDPAKKTLPQFLSIMSDRMKHFFGEIHKHMPAEFFRDIKYMEVILHLVRYDFAGLLQKFSVFNFNQQITIENTAPFSTIIDDLENILMICNEFPESMEQISLIGELVEYSKDVPQHKPDSDVDFVFGRDILFALDNFIHDVLAFHANVRLREIIRYVTRDFSYQPPTLVITIEMEKVYTSYKETVFTREWENHYRNKKKEELDHILLNFFHNQRIKNLDNYNQELIEKVNKQSPLPLISYYKINIIYQFLNAMYKSSIQPVIAKILVNGLFKSEEYKGQISSSYHFLNNCIGRIEEFDKKFDQYNELGPKIKYYLKQIMFEPKLRIHLKQIAEEVNAEINEIINSFFNAIGVLEDFFKQCSYTLTPGNEPVNNLEEINFPGVTYYFDAIEKNVKYLEDFRKLYKLITDTF